MSLERRLFWNFCKTIYLDKFFLRLEKDKRINFIYTHARREVSEHTATESDRAIDERTSMQKMFAW